LVVPTSMPTMVRCAISVPSQELRMKNAELRMNQSEIK
jgi:hypothetical protein